MSKEKFAKGRQAIKKEDSKGQFKRGAGRVAVDFIRPLAERGVIINNIELVSQKDEKRAI